MSKVLCVIGARLNSSRLPKKHLLDLAGKPLIARIFERLEQVPEIDDLVLATTADDYNRPLVDWAENAGKAVFAYQGDVNDLVGRVDAVVRQYQPDILVYCCGDSPLIEPQTLRRLIQTMLENPSTDSAHPEPAANGQPYIHEGFDIYSRRLWEQVNTLSISPEHREHVGSVIREWTESPRSIAAKEEPIFAEIQHRLSVDTVSDYHFMSTVYQAWYDQHPADEIVSLPLLIEQLKIDPALRTINHLVHQKVVGETALKALLVTCTDAKVGLGHLSRCVAVARLLQDRLGAGVELAIVGKQRVLPQLLNCNWFGEFSAVNDYYSGTQNHLLVIDWPWKVRPLDQPLLALLTECSAASIGIDAPAGFQDSLDAVYIPSCVVKNESAYHAEQLTYGWDCYLFAEPAQQRSWQEAEEILVLTGGGDSCGLGKTLPALLDQTLPAATRVHWVQGPYADPPLVPDNARCEWLIEQSPNPLDPLFDNARLVLSVFGISCFEALRAGLPVVVFSPYGDRDVVELSALAEAGVAEVAESLPAAAQSVLHLMTDEKLSRERAKHAWQFMQRANGDRLIQVVRELMGL